MARRPVVASGWLATYPSVMRRNLTLGLIALLLLLAAGVVTWRQGVAFNVALEGFLFGVPFYLAPTLAIIGIWGMMRRRKRRETIRRGDCPTCGYSLVGNTSGVCPECRTPIDAAR